MRIMKLIFFLKLVNLFILEVFKKTLTYILELMLNYSID